MSTLLFTNFKNINKSDLKKGALGHAIAPRIVRLGLILVIARNRWSKNVVTRNADNNFSSIPFKMEHRLPVFRRTTIKNFKFITLKRDNVPTLICSTIFKSFCYNSQLDETFTLVDSFGSFSLFWPKRCPDTKYYFHNFF